MLNEIDNVCEFKNCDEWTVDLDYLNKQAVASCYLCDPYYGLWEYETDHYVCSECVANP